MVSAQRGTSYVWIDALAMARTSRAATAEIERKLGEPWHVPHDPELVETTEITNSHHHHHEEPPT